MCAALALGWNNPSGVLLYDNLLADVRWAVLWTAFASPCHFLRAFSATLTAPETALIARGAPTLLPLLVRYFTISTIFRGLLDLSRTSRSMPTVPVQCGAIITYIVVPA